MLSRLHCILYYGITTHYKNDFKNKLFIIIDDSDDSAESDDNLGTLNLDGWTSFIGSADDIAKILNMRLCLTLAYREFLKNKMISQHSVNILI